MVHFDGKVVYEFLGIPYADKPVNDLRFKNTRPLSSNWTGVRDATKHGPACPQHKDVGQQSEDCLYLNIWTPEKGSQGDASKHVMVYLHGGSFNMGTASDSESNGTVLAAKHDVVVVTANYRIGFNGFLYAHEDDHSNMGLRDQVSVLAWVAKNIAAFGGDAKRVSLFGHSAGAISAGILSLSPLRKGMFERAILQSGSPYSFLRPVSMNTSLSRALAFSRFLNCSTGSEDCLSRDGLRCLRQVPLDQLMAYGKEEKLHSLILPNPLFGDDVLPQPVALLLQATRTPAAATTASRSKQQQQVQQQSSQHESSTTGDKAIDWIVGFEEGEGELFLMAQVKGVFGKKNRDREITYEEAMQALSSVLAGKLTKEEQERVRQHYLSLGSQMTSSQLKDTLIRIYGDLYVYCPSLFLAEAVVKRFSGQARVYMYELTSTVSKPVHRTCTKICHGEETPFVFGHPFQQSSEYDDRDRRLSAQVMHHWTQFAKNGYDRRVLLLRAFSLSSSSLLPLPLSLTSSRSLSCIASLYLIDHLLITSFFNLHHMLLSCTHSLCLCIGVREQSGCRSRIRTSIWFWEKMCIRET